MATVWSTMRGAASHATLLLCEQFFVSIRYIFSVLSVATFCYFCYYCRLSSALFRWEAASAGSGQSNARRSKNFWRCPRRVRCDLGSLVLLDLKLECGAGECSAHVADTAAKGCLLCPRTGCGTGDAACLDLDLRRRAGPGRAAMAQNSPGPMLRTVLRTASDPVFVARRRILVRLCKTGFKAQPGQINFAGVNISRICIYRRLR